MKKPVRPRTYLPAEAAQAIYLAGAGESASHIADLIGNTTAARVRALLSDYGVPLLHRRAGQTALVILIRDENASEIAGLAADKGYGSAQFVGAMIDNIFKAKRDRKAKTEAAK